ncbi:nucleoside hydrolase-like domain-containing protein, partial [Pedobacter sp.]|uniref:nucleoside hydrolase-like domain-containing protein n=1 Tax=Pedobacter sp. TaxID=1411316 RepID=UPI003C3608A0
WLLFFILEPMKGNNSFPCPLTQINLSLLIGLLVAFAFIHNTCEAQRKPRILISSDIGGTDPDDFQSMIHLLMYANEFQIEGLVASPFENGRKKDFIKIINLYEKDLPKLNAKGKGFPSASDLRDICKQGSIPAAPFKGYANATEGSDWIIECAKRKSEQPLWLLVWGGIEDVAQAVHDAPEIKQKIRVYWIGGPNKKWSINAYNYIAEHHPDLWMIENNATYRGWMMDEESPAKLKSKAFYSNYIKGYGEMGKDFINYYNGNIKMGDTPSLAYLIKGNPNKPSGESWGGSFTQLNRSAKKIFIGNSGVNDTVAVYGILEWHFIGPALNIDKDSVCFEFETGGQQWPGYYIGNGTYAVRYSSKKPETGSYKIKSNIKELDGQSGNYVSVSPWPGKPNEDDFKVGAHWYSDRDKPELFLGDQQGARTISKYRSEFLMDWAKRWSWLK